MNNILQVECYKSNFYSIVHNMIVKNIIKDNLSLQGTLL